MVLEEAKILYRVDIVPEGKEVGPELSSVQLTEGLLQDLFRAPRNPFEDWRSPSGRTNQVIPAIPPGSKDHGQTVEYTEGLPEIIRWKSGAVCPDDDHFFKPLPKGESEGMAQPVSQCLPGLIK